MSKIITIWQPWASAIAFELKQNETRSWGTKYRGPLLIHAAKRIPSVGETRHLRDHVGTLFSLDMLADHFGCIVAIADLCDCIKMTESLIKMQTPDELAWGDWRPGGFAWRLENVRALQTPIPWRGQQGLRPAPQEVMEKALAEAGRGRSTGLSLGSLALFTGCCMNPGRSIPTGKMRSN